MPLRTKGEGGEGEPPMEFNDNTPEAGEKERPPQEGNKEQAHSPERALQDFESSNGRMRDLLESGDSPLAKTKRAVEMLYDTVSKVRVGGQVTGAARMVERIGEGLAQLLQSIKTVSGEMDSGVAQMRKQGLDKDAISQARTTFERLQKLQRLAERYVAEVTPTLGRVRTWAIDAYREQLFSEKLAEEVVGGAERAAAYLRPCISQIENIKVKWEDGVRGSLRQ